MSPEPLNKPLTAELSSDNVTAPLDPPPLRPEPAATDVMSPVCPLIVTVLPLCVTLTPVPPTNVNVSPLVIDSVPALSVVNPQLL